MSETGFEVRIENRNTKYPYINIEKVVLECFKELQVSPSVAVAYWALRQLADFATKETKIYQNNLAKWALQSPRTLADSLKTLKELGFIEIEQNYNKERKQFLANTYTILPVTKIAAQLKIDLKQIKESADVLSFDNKEKSEEQEKFFYIESIKSHFEDFFKSDREKWERISIFCVDDFAIVQMVDELSKRNEILSKKGAKIPVVEILKKLAAMRVETMMNIHQRVLNYIGQGKVVNNFNFLIMSLYNGDLTDSAC